MEYTLTLNRAHKIVERLKADVVETSGKACASLPITFPLPLSIVKTLDANSTEFNTAMSSVEYMQKLIMSIRTKVSAKNESVGVSSRLTEIEYETTMINFLTGRLNQMKSAVSRHDVNSQNAAYVKMSGDTTLFGQRQVVEMWARANKILAVSDTLADTLVVDIADRKNKIRRLTDEISDANRATIVVEIEDDVAKRVGLM